MGRHRRERSSLVRGKPGPLLTIPIIQRFGRNESLPGRRQEPLEIGAVISKAAKTRPLEAG